jgi:vancomycin resistance protein VanW
MIKAPKRLLRLGYRSAKNLLHGYTFAYARQQAPAQAHQCPYLWYRASTPIPDRGSAEIRANRVANLQLAASKINQLQLNPGQIFSFAHRVGEPSLDSGFKSGPVFVRGEVKTGVGGGLCLIATNLFELFLNSGCQILERHCHSIDAYGNDRFYALGQDAAVAYGYKDLMVRNDSAVVLQLQLQVLPETGQVVSSLWGTAPAAWEVQIRSAILQEIPSTLANGVSGWIVSTQRHRRDLTSSASLDSFTWQQDYHAISHYQPCQDQTRETAKVKTRVS